MGGCTLYEAKLRGVPSVPNTGISHLTNGLVVAKVLINN